MRSKTRLGAVAVTLLMVAATPATVVAQDRPSSVTFDEELLQGTTWELSRYAVDGTLADVPPGVTATLHLAAGQATGEGGCNSFGTSYELNAHIIRLAEPIERTEQLCEGAAQEVEDAYLTTLPTLVAWSIADGQLVMVDDTEMPTLVFGDGTFPISVSDFLAIGAELERQADELEALDLRITSIESGGASDGTGEPAASAPRAPRPRGTVERQFAELGADPERGLVRWMDRSDDEDGYRVFARRIQCVGRGGDIREQPSAWVRVARLPANAEQYRPRHDQIDAAIEPQNERVVASGALYEIGVASFNEAGQSPRTVVGAYFTTPEYSCP